MKIVNSPQSLVYSLLSILILLSFFGWAESAPAVSFEELIEGAQDYDGKKIVFKGEAIGDVMIRGEFAWINVRDETGVIGVYCAKDLVSEIEHTGGYKYKGDIISVRGTFHRFCSQHGGDTDIHAERISVIQKGEEIPHALEPEKVKASIILPAIAFALAIIYLIIRKLK